MPCGHMIAPDQETALKEEEDDNSQFHIYTDGSGFEGYVGTSAVLYRNGVQKGKSRYRLGGLSRHTVFKGELVGLSLGTELLQKQSSITKVTFYTDNQAGIQALGLFKLVPRHHLMDLFLIIISRI